MKRKIKIFCCLSIIVMFSLCLVSCKKKTTPTESFPQIVSGLKSYKMVGKLETNFPSGTKESVITTYYKSPGFYRVEIQNPNAVETQVMIKNDQGVFVLIPSVNKTFKVNTVWPTNNSYPYLLQSLSNDIVSDESINMTEDTKEITLKAKLYNASDNLTQKITFGEDNMPKEVVIYDSNKNVIMKYTVNQLETNISLDDGLFVANQTLETLYTYYQENPVEYDRYVTYPTYYPEGTSLKEETVTGSGDERVVIMKFSGECSYTIIEEYITDTKASKVEYMSSDVMVIGGVFGFVGTNNVEFYENGIEYTIASNDVSILEMIKTLDSLRTTDIK